MELLAEAGPRHAEASGAVQAERVREVREVICCFSRLLMCIMAKVQKVHFRNMQFACPTFCLALSVSGRDEMFGQAQRQLCRVATCACIVVLYCKWFEAFAMCVAQICFCRFTRMCVCVWVCVSDEI